MDYNNLDFFLQKDVDLPEPQREALVNQNERRFTTKQFNMLTSKDRLLHNKAFDVVRSRQKANTIYR